ncbi:MAG: MFS transporter [Ectothiorhodospiraceae bacterium]|nr:MFS transporter [Chromatiales bacterium]MCP5154434.1 MFS transporter [Ectothiorhodospiraceae bacterium]
MFGSGVGQSHIFSVFISPISEDLGISRTSVSTAYAAATLVAAFGLPYTGRLVDRFGVRAVLVGIAVLLGFAAIGFANVGGMLALGLGFAALRFLGQGSLMLCCNNLVSQWFSRKRGFALSLMALGFALSMALHPPFAQWLNASFGWRGAWMWLAVITWLLLLPPVLLLVIHKPEEIGLEPDGKAAEESGDAEERARHSARAGLTLAQALRTSAFWVIAFGLSTLSMLVTALFFHQVSIFETQGISREIAARIFPISAVTMVAVMPLFGRALDRFRPRWVFAVALLTMTLSLVMVTFVRDLTTAVVYAIVFGVNNAAIHTHFTFMWPRFFGRRHLGSIQGAGQTIAVVGASLGPLPFGIAFDLYGSFEGALLLFALQPLVAAVLVVFLRPPRLADYAEQ